MMSMVSGTERLLTKIEVTHFDGNCTDNMDKWAFADDGFDGVDEDFLNFLSDLMVHGNLHWVVFVPFGYRIGVA